jgi:hypothetical protein
MDEGGKKGESELIPNLLERSFVFFVKINFIYCLIKVGENFGMNSQAHVDGKKRKRLLIFLKYLVWPE